MTIDDNSQLVNLLLSPESWKYETFNTLIYLTYLY